LVVKPCCSSVWKNWENSIRSRVLRMTLSQSAALHDVASRRAASRALTATHPLGSERRGSRRPAGPCAVEPPFLSYLGATCLASMGRRTRAAPPNQPRAGIHAARRRRPLRAVLRPCHDPYLDLVPLARKKTSLTALCTTIKPAGPSSRGRRAAAVRHGCLTVNSTPACFSSPTRAASHSFRTPCSSCARLLVCSSCQLARVVSPTAAAGQPSTSSAFRSSPEPTHHLSASLDPSEAARATR
jgi:hypothetical protein